MAIHWDKVKYIDRSDHRGKRPMVWVVCEECGAGRWVRKTEARKLKPRHWCAKCGPIYAHWKGGRRTRPDGYVRVVVSSDHPHPSERHRNRAYMLEHRVVMEQHLGRYLKPEEVVHHINGDPSDNRIENLRLCASQADHVRNEHAGS